MDELDIKILDLLKGNARMTYQELGNELGMSRVAAKKREKLIVCPVEPDERAVIREYRSRTRDIREQRIFLRHLIDDRKCCTQIKITLRSDYVSADHAKTRLR